MNLNKAEIRRLQGALKAKGFDPGPIDGIWGPKTERAVIAFKRSIGYRARAYVGPLTWNALMKDARPIGPKLGNVKLPSWLRIAMGYRGLREYKGSSHNKTILKWWRDIGLGGIRDDETAWCAAYVGGCLVEAGLPSTKSALARSYDKWGRQLDKPAVGSVVTFWRERPSSWKGHVGFVVGVSQRQRLMVLGGNQGDQVNIKAFSASRVIGFRWPVNVPERPSYNLPVIQSDGTLSTDES